MSNTGKSLYLINPSFILISFLHVVLRDSVLALRLRGGGVVSRLLRHRFYDPVHQRAGVLLQLRVQRGGRVGVLFAHAHRQRQRRRTRLTLERKQFAGFSLKMNRVKIGLHYGVWTIT